MVIVFWLICGFVPQMYHIIKRTRARDDTTTVKFEPLSLQNTKEMVFL